MSGPGLIQRTKTVQAEKQPEICGSKRKQAIKQNDLCLSFDLIFIRLYWLCLQASRASSDCGNAVELCHEFLMNDTVKKKDYSLALMMFNWCILQKVSNRFAANGVEGLDLGLVKSMCSTESHSSYSYSSIKLTWMKRSRVIWWSGASSAACCGVGYRD